MSFELAFLGVYAFLLVILSFYGGHRYLMAYLYYRHKKRVPVPLGHFADSDLPVVTVQLPIYNEQYVIERLIDAICAFDYPSDKMEIQVLDDSTDETCAVASSAVDRMRAEGHDIVYIHRMERMGYKAGALEAGAAVAKGEYIAVFDADFVPEPDFLKRTVHFFTDAKIAMVQTRWDHINRRFSLLTRAQAIILDGHFIMESCARNRSGRFFNFNGTAGIWRKSAILDAGGWQHDTLTEDLDLSYRAQVRGWNFVFLKDTVAPAEIPVEMNAFKTQQHRWTKGSIQTGLKLLPSILRSDLSFKVKMEAFFHLSNNIAYVFMVLLCLMMPLSIPIRSHFRADWLGYMDFPVFLLATGAIAFFYMAAQREVGIGVKERFKYLPLVLSMGVGICLNNAKAVIEALTGHETGFVRTPKYRVEEGGNSDWKNKMTKYHKKMNWLPYGELALGIWFTLAVIYVIYAAAVDAQYGLLFAVPFLALFQFGFLYISLQSMFQTRSGGLFAAFSQLFANLTSPNRD
jgi:cellulose synthase/poly-beta-1,6-N-acetylglucosamine synthase-like glycosyltransferase